MKKIDKIELHYLFENIKLKNRTSFDMFYEKYQNIVYGISFTICHDRYISEEVTQNVFLKIWELPSEKFPSNNESSWIYTITKNETIDILRKKIDYFDIDNIYNVQDSNNEIENIIDINDFNRKIDSLNSDEQEIVSLKILSNFTFKEIGELLGIPTATAQWKYYKSLNSLKLALANFAMFILSFAAYLKTKTSTNKKNSHTKSIDSIDLNISSSDSKIDTNFEGINITPNTSSYGTSTQAKNISYNIKPLFFGISSVFLVFTIIFTIIFTKHQQKRLKKTSKHYTNN